MAVAFVSALQQQQIRLRYWGYAAELVGPTMRRLSLVSDEVIPMVRSHVRENSVELTCVLNISMCTTMSRKVL